MFVVFSSYVLVAFVLSLGRDLTGWNAIVACGVPLGVVGSATAYVQISGGDTRTPLVICTYLLGSVVLVTGGHVLRAFDDFRIWFRIPSEGAKRYGQRTGTFQASAATLAVALILTDHFVFGTQHVLRLAMPLTFTVILVPAALLVNRLLSRSVATSSS